MAILFDVPLTQNLLHLVGVNNIIKFYTDSLLDIKNAEITIPNNGDPIVKTIFPGPSNKFYYNFKEIISIIINKDGFKDDIDFSLVVNDWTAKAYLYEQIEIKINFVDTSFETEILDTSWVNMILQHYNYRFNYYSELLRGTAWLLKPKHPEKKHRIKYWKGYPFSFGFYTGQFAGGTANGQLQGGGPIQYFFNFPTVTRLVVSDGLNENINFLYNENSYKMVIGGTGFKFNFTRIVSDCLKNNNIYIKWLNSFGDFDYWLFKRADTERKIKGLGVIDNDFGNFEGTTSPFQNIGVNGSDSLKVFETFSEDDMVYIADMFISPKIYLFRGLPNQVSTQDDWVEITLASGGNQIVSRKYQNTQLELEFNMPDLITRKL
jgi:hypothetical protein